LPGPYICMGNGVTLPPSESDTLAWPSFSTSSTRTMACIGT